MWKKLSFGEKIGFILIATSIPSCFVLSVSSNFVREPRFNQYEKQCTDIGLTLKSAVLVNGEVESITCGK